MSHFCTGRHIKKGGEPIADGLDALGVIALAMSDDPASEETIVLVLDDERRGHTILVVDGTDHPDAVVEIADTIANAVARHPFGASVVIASVRPRHPVEPGDLDRWLEASDRLAGAGGELVEWFVITGTDCADAECPRDLLGEAPRWGPAGPGRER